MRILVLGGSMLTGALRLHGHQVYSVGFEEGHDLVITHPFTSDFLLKHLKGAGFEAEAFFYCDNGNLPLLLDPEKIPCPSVWFTIDTYCNPWHVPYGYGFDYSLVAQKDYVFLFDGEKLPARWFPLFCSARLLEKESSIRDVPVSFVGGIDNPNNPRRKPFLHAFQKLHPLVLLTGDFIPVFLRSKIVLNQTAAAELNFRCFEAMGLGAALLMEECDNGLHELFTENENILPTYRRDDASDCARIAKEALADPRRLASIAKNGRDLIAQKHTDMVRAKELLALFEELRVQKAHEKRLHDDRERRSTLLRSAFGVLATDLQKEGMERYAHFYARIYQEG